MPAYNAGRTLRLTYEELPKDTVNLVILVDDGSTDATLDIARQLGLEIFVHNRNYGYGANQKTCYAEALRALETVNFPASASFFASVGYGLRILAVLFCFTLNPRGLRRSRRFDSLRPRYSRLP